MSLDSWMRLVKESGLTVGGRLSVLPSDWDMAPQPARTRAFRLDVDHVRQIDAHGGETAHPQMSVHPFYFFVDGGGRVTGVAHHESEDTDTLSSKRAMAATHQLLIGAATRAGHEWRGEEPEDDAVGAADAVYAVAGGRGLLRPRRVVRKWLNFHEGAAVPHGFEYTINSTSILEPDGTARHIRQLSHFAPRFDKLRPRGGAGSATSVSHEGYEFLPRTPRVVEWRRVSSRPLPHERRRRLAADEEAAMVGAPLRHGVAPPTVHRMQRDERWRRADAADEADDGAGVPAGHSRPRPPPPPCAPKAVEAAAACLREEEAETETETETETAGEEERKRERGALGKAREACLTSVQEFAVRCPRGVRRFVVNELLGNGGRCAGSGAARCGLLVNALVLVVERGHAAARDADERDDEEGKEEGGGAGGWGGGGGGGGGPSRCWPRF